MPEKTLREQRDYPTAAVAAFLDSAWAVVTPKLYAANPFRVLGCSVLSSSRDISRRYDQLKLAAELGNPLVQGSFALVPAASPDTLRTAVQGLKDPRQRFLSELFWFWPQSFQKDEEDAALQYLAVGATSDAVSVWATAAINDDVAALHNLTVYHHLMAIEQEQTHPPLPEDDVLAWWRAAIRYWQELSGSDAFWERLRARVLEVGDPQLPVECVEALRRECPFLLAAIHSALAFRAAEKGATTPAARHVALLGDIFSDAPSTRRALERGASPAVRRIDARLAEMKRESSTDPTRALAAARALVEHCAPDIQTLDTLCGRDSDFFAEICTRMAAPALEAVVAYQRGAGENAACLPLLVYLETLPMTPEAQRRVRETFEVIFANAVSDDTKARPDAQTGEGAEPGYSRSYRVIANQTIPPVYLLQIDDEARRACTEQLAELLKRVAKDACAERDDIAFALHAYNTVLQLPSDAKERARWEKERDRFQQEFLRRKEKELRTPLGDHILEITSRTVRWDDQSFSPDEITAVRLGVIPPNKEETGRERRLIAWRAGEREIILDEQNVFSDPQTAEAQYRRILDALYFFVVPRVADRILAAVRRGEAVSLGAAVLERAGMRLTTHSRLWKRDAEIPYSKLKHHLEDSVWVVSSAENSRLQERYSTADTWNAAVMGYVIDALARSG